MAVMGWPDLVKVLRPLGWKEGSVGHWMFPMHIDDRRRIEGGFDGRAEVFATRAPWEHPIFSGTYAEVVEYLKGGQSNG